MQRTELDFELPEELIARHPSAQRDASRLLVHHSASAQSSHASFDALDQFLRAGDLLVLNNTRVLPARLALRKTTGGRVEGLWLSAVQAEPGSTAQGEPRAQLMLSGGRLRPGVQLCDEQGDAVIELLEKTRPGRWLARSLRGAWPQLLEEVGTPPLPPYIRRLRLAAGEAEIHAEDRERYQTVWAGPSGSVAAPTASLHFTPQLLQRLSAMGVERTELTLHVGLGTFAPVEADELQQHVMHAEEFSLDETCAQALRQARADGQRVIAVGTTVARVLESLPKEPDASHGWTELFVLPGHRFRCLDGLLTNFHTPHSTLLALVAALCQYQGGQGLSQVKQVYAEAIAERYRFYSYGDASLWLP
jgi:S-adenosylmethionine:tRNA ribosyltransferase-isomerase